MREFKVNSELITVHHAEGSINKYHGWPSVCKDDRGVIYAAASGFRITHVDPCGKNCMYLSFNEGKTWTPPVVVHDSYLDDRDTGITYIGDGKMVMSWFSLRYEDNCRGMQDYDWLNPAEKSIVKGVGDSWDYLPAEEVQGGSFVCTSYDYGVTWTKPVRVPVTAPHGPSVTADGTLVYMGKKMDPDYLADNPIVVYTSKDDGLTWEYTGSVPPGDDIIVENMHEPHVVELPGGRLMGAIRIHERKTQPDFTVYITFSDDKGKTWTKPYCTEVDGAPPHLLVHSSGAIVLSYSRRRAEGNRGERCAVSYDGGNTWAEDYNIDDDIRGGGDLGYPASVELSDGSILTVYYQCRPNEWNTSVLAKKWKLGADNNEEIK